jgi:hypothetical protein
VERNATLSGSGEVGHNSVAQRLDAVANNRHDNHAQAGDGCGQYNPVYSYGASFVGEIFLKRFLSFMVYSLSGEVFI